MQLFFLNNVVCRYDSIAGLRRESNSALRNAYEKGFASLRLIANVALDEKAYYIHPENKRVYSSESDEAAFLDSVYDQLDILYNIGSGRERIYRPRPTRKDISDAVVAETGLPSVGHTMSKKLSSMLCGLARPQLPELSRTTGNMTLQNSTNISFSDSDVQSDDAVAPSIYENTSAATTSISDTDNLGVPSAHADDTVVAVSPGRAASQRHTTKSILPRAYYQEQITKNA
ncbi:hypothetical protein KCU67_g5681, partial [Aureobasidium melanogenum]